MKNNKRNQGITLIALVVTIVVLLILAGVSIAMLTGENGVITQAKNSKEATEQAKVEELVSVAIGSVIAKNNGSTAGITPKMIADQINEDERRSDVYAEDETTFPTNIIFPKENRKAEANLNSGSSTSDPDAIYSEDVNEADIAPADLFDYEIINDGSTGALTLNSLPTKTVKITRIKPQYCNIDGYNPDTKTNDLSDTNYGVVKDNRTYNRLIIPYQVDGKYIPNGIEGEYYKVIEVNLSVKQINERTHVEDSYVSVPDIDELIYPNTVVKICSVGRVGYNKLKKIILPNKIEEIPEGFFGGSELLTSVTIPDSVKFIDFYAFAGCQALTNIILPKGITDIEAYTFLNCNKLESILIPESVENIGEGAFYGCSNLENISIPDDIEYIGGGAFEDTKFGDNLPDGEIYIGKVYYEYKGEMPNGTIIKIKDGTKSIADGAFYNCSGLEKIEMPDSVEYIGSEAFSECSSMSSISISNNLIWIGMYAFMDCTSLTSIILPDTVKYIDIGAFRRCHNLSSIRLSSNLEEISNYLFEDCWKLTSIEIPNKVTAIGTNAFDACKSIENITIPDSVTNMGRSAFVHWTSDQTINIQFKENEIPTGWNSNWKDECNAVIKYLD